MFCFECIYWNDKEEKCTLNYKKCIADKIPEPKEGDENDKFLD